MGGVERIRYARLCLNYNLPIVITIPTIAITVAEIVPPTIAPVVDAAVLFPVQDPCIVYSN